MAEQESCIFCRIVRNEIPSYKVWEDADFLAFLDIYPNIRGQTLVIPKRHIKSNPYSIEEEELVSLIRATRKVAKILQKRLKVKRVHLVIEGMGVNHLHAKLYPAVGADENKMGEAYQPEPQFFERYPGHTTTLLGPKATQAYLEDLQNEITKEE
ncbi:MAG TPA: HIT domain-containing protein [Candidatus Aquilonibacter sp.]|nr:HIT domain-containing protein [Candidatus Aquilonibacter sp.]